MRRGFFRFDAVRSGAHTLELLPESLPEGATASGPRALTVTLSRGALVRDMLFLVQIRTRPEIRRQFPPSDASRASGGAPEVGKDPARAVAPRPAPSSSAGRTTALIEPGANIPADRERYTIQIAVLNDPHRARRMVQLLRGRGFPAYLVEPAASDPNAPYKVRAGEYDTRAAAQKAARVLSVELSEKLWVIRVR